MKKNLSPSFDLTLGPGEDQGNVDVEITFSTGEVYFATFFSLAHLPKLMDRWQESGECASGLYCWAKNMIIVRTLDEASIRRSIQGLLDEGEFYDAVQGPTD